MSAQFPSPELPVRLLGEVPMAGLNAATALVGRRTQALADYWQAAAVTRQPSEFLGLQLGYWTHLLDDYGQALTESFAPFTAEAPSPDEFALVVVEPKPTEPHAAGA